MIAASQPRQRPPDARLLAIDARGHLAHWPRQDFSALLRPGDLVVANDAATLPASLAGRHERTGAAIEVRIAQALSLAPDALGNVAAIVFGEGDWRTTTEARPLPPALLTGDLLALGPLRARVVALRDHPRFVTLRFEDDAARVWHGFARHGRPVQYAYLEAPLALWDVWSPLAGPPVALEAPSASFVIDWRSLHAFRERGVGFATLTHAAGLSSTGDAALDARLPLDEPYRIPNATARAIAATKAAGGRVIAVGTTVVRALEHAASRDGEVRAGEGIATQRVGPRTPLRVVDAILSGTHERGSSHHALLRAFTDAETLERADAELERAGYRTHEFGDSVLVERRATRQ